MFVSSVWSTDAKMRLGSIQDSPDRDWSITMYSRTVSQISFRHHILYIYIILEYGVFE